ncbi:MAG: SprB repeat-containing protein [Chitinophagaceae bacterium]
MATAGGGTTPYSYAINGGTYQSSNSFTGITQGSYTITVKDANNCTKTTTINITQPSALTLSSSATPILCNGGNSTLTATAGGGTTPYSYAINGGTYQSSNSFTGITQGSYTITVKDANNCTKTTTINITQPSALTLSSSATPILCNGGNSTLTATAGGGTTPYSYAINGGTYQSSNSFTGITQGSYTITVKDANNCTKTTTINISQPTALAITTLTATIPSCVPGNDATITTTASGGTSPYSYSLNGGVYQSTSQFINQGVGNYTITVKDANNCTVSSTISVIKHQTPKFCECR